MKEDLMAFVPLLIISALWGVASHMLAKDKGRKVWLWTLLGCIPFVNMACIPFFVGAANLTLDRKLDAILARLNKSPQ